MYLKRLDESPKQCAYTLPSTEQFDKAHHTEQSEEVDTDNTRTFRLQTEHCTIQAIPYTYLGSIQGFSYGLVILQWTVSKRGERYEDSNVADANFSKSFS